MDIDNIDLRQFAAEENKRQRRKGKTRNGAAKVKPNLLAMINSVVAHPDWQGAVRWNGFTEAMEVCDPWPPSGFTTGMRQLSETFDKLEATLWLQGNGFPSANKGVAFDIMLKVALNNAYHPVRDYFANLPRWDGTERISGLFRTYFNADVPEVIDGDEESQTEWDHRVAYLEHVSRCFMISAVARIHQPGCKADNLPVLVGPEAYCKSLAIESLCEDPRWFSDDVPTDIGSKDAKEALVAKWVVELAEIPHQRLEVEKVKAFLVRRYDRYRVPYEKLAADQPRTSIFVGTSNDLELISVTGNRRFWPVEVADRIDVAAIVRDRTQLWAEALHAFRANEPWWLQSNIEAIARERQEAHEEYDVWQDELGDWISSRTNRDDPFSMEDAMRGAGLMPGLFNALYI